MEPPRMPEETFAAQPAGAPGWVLDAAALAMAGVVAAGMALGDVSAGLVLALTVHVFVSLYHGRFGRFRKLTWLMLFLGWTLSFLVGFLGYVLPCGQLSFWIAAHLGDTFANLVWKRRELVGILLPAAGIVVGLGMLLDSLALQGPRLRSRRAVQLAAGILGLAIVLAAARDVTHLMNATTGRPPPAQDVAIVPPFKFLPFYALLRAGPTKLLGVALVPLLAILAALWPWRRAWRFHAAPTRWAFTALWLAAGASWLGLGVLGSLTADFWVITASQAFVLYEIAFLAAAPLVLARFVRPIQDGHVEDRRADVF